MVSPSSSREGRPAARRADGAAGKGRGRKRRPARNGSDRGCEITPRDAGALVNVKMTLTAPGCGMGPVLAQEAKAKIESLPGVDEANVELVWEPPWNQAMMSDVAKLETGML